MGEEIAKGEGEEFGAERERERVIYALRGEGKIVREDKILKEGYKCLLQEQNQNQPGIFQGP